MARLSRQEAKQRTRAELLDAAAKVFSERGYEGASVAEIAERAGRTTGAIYAHFPTKEALFLGVAVRAVRKSALPGREHPSGSHRRHRSRRRLVHRRLEPNGRLEPPPARVLPVLHQEPRTHRGIPGTNRTRTRFAGSHARGPVHTRKAPRHPSLPLSSPPSSSRSKTGSGSNTKRTPISRFEISTHTHSDASQDREQRHENASSRVRP